MACLTMWHLQQKEAFLLRQVSLYTLLPSVQSDLNG